MLAESPKDADQRFTRHGGRQSRVRMKSGRRIGRGRPMVEVQRLEECAEGRIGALKAIGEVAAVDLANEDDYPDEHGAHANESSYNALDEVDDEQVRGVPSPEDRVGQVPIAEDVAVAERDEELGDDEGDDGFQDQADRHVVADCEDGQIEDSRRDRA